MGISVRISIREFARKRWVYSLSNKLICVPSILLNLLLTDNKWCKTLKVLQIWLQGLVLVHSPWDWETGAAGALHSTVLISITACYWKRYCRIFQTWAAVLWRWTKNIWGKIIVLRKYFCEQREKSFQFSEIQGVTAVKTGILPFLPTSLQMRSSSEPYSWSWWQLKPSFA